MYKTIPVEIFLEYIDQCEIPPYPPETYRFNYQDKVGFSLLECGLNYEAKLIANNQGMWAIVDLAWTKKLADWIDGRKVLEVMAGRGWLAKALNHYDVDIVATDNKSWHEGQTLFDIERKDAVAAARESDGFDIMIMSWPPYAEPLATETCKAWGTDRPIVYIGENEGGCCADDDFFDHFSRIKGQPGIYVPQWYGLHDWLEIGYWRE
jgi:hypothetical protein